MDEDEEVLLGMAVQDKTTRVKIRLQTALKDYRDSETFWNRLFNRAKIQESADKLLYRIRAAVQWIDHVCCDVSLQEVVNEAIDSGVLKYDLPVRERRK
jgi:hypothetical protein